MKKAIGFISLFLLVFILSGCSYKIIRTDEGASSGKQQTQINTGNDIFTKKQECGKLISKSQEDVQKKQDMYTSNYEVRQVFYSPKLDTCLMAYSYTFCYEDFNDKTPAECVAKYEIEDILTTNNVFKTEQTKDNDAYRELTNKIEELSN